MLENTEGGKKTIQKGEKRQSRETGNIEYTRRRKVRQKHNILCVVHHYAETNTNNVNKTCTLLQTTEGNIVFSSPGQRPSELWPSIGIRPSYVVNFHI